MKKFSGAIFLYFLVLVFTIALGGCRSPFVAATITNNSGSNITLIEVDYPSASFGVGALASGAQYHYRFKIQGSGPIKMQFTDASGKTHSSSGPDMAEGEQGSVAVTVGSANEISWIPNLAKIK